MGTSAPQHRARLLIAALSFSVSLGCLGATPSVGDIVEPHDIRHDGCELSNFYSITVENPQLENGEDEFNIYYLFLCPQAGKQSLVIWRTRHYKGKEQLVGVLRVPQESIRKAAFFDKSKKKTGYSFAGGTCRLRDGKVVNAVLNGLFVDLINLKPKHLIVAWHVDAESKSLLPIPRSEVLSCEVPAC